MSEPTTALEHVVSALQRAAAYDRNDRRPPVALLWPDKSQGWQPVVDRLRGLVPIYTLGEYDNDASRGPAYWLRCIVDRELPGSPPGDEIPVIYLPGFERSDLRAVETCPPALQPLAELQYRGALFARRGGKDWTVTGFFQNAEQGLGIEVASDQATSEAFGRALPVLLDRPVEELRAKMPLRADFLNGLLNPDPVSAVLEWLNAPATFATARGSAEWAAFRDGCRETYGVDPAADGPISAAALLGAKQGAWEAVWERFARAPSVYPNVPEQLRAARPQELVLDHPDTWPQTNEELEDELRTALAGLRDRASDEVRQRVRELELRHAARRDWVWATLGKAPLAQALGHLAALARHTEDRIAGASVQEIAATYADSGWRADDALLGALAAVDASADRAAVAGVCAALYRGWADEGARSLQAAATSNGANGFGDPLKLPESGECLLFTDGLRLDLAHRLADLLRSRAFDVSVDWRLCALPSLTPTAKPALSPVANAIGPGQNFDTVLVGSGQAVNAESLRRTISSSGVQVLAGDEVGDTSSAGWTEFGNIDQLGHSREDRFAQAIGGELRDLADRAAYLLSQGWKEVRIVTDHGWLYVPGGLDKVDLPQHLTAIRKGRAARLVDGVASVAHPVVPWRWDADVRVAVAPGLGCYVAGREYEHGGISPQECVVPVVTVRSAPAALSTVSVGEPTWIGLRLRVTATGVAPSFSIDLRTKPGDPATSVTVKTGHFDESGAASLLADDDRAGEAAVIVVLDAAGQLVGQRHTTVGGE